MEMDMGMDEMPQEYIKQKSVIPTPAARVAKFLLVFCSINFLFFGFALVFIGLYIQLDHGFVSQIIGSSIYLAASYICIVTGFLVIFLTFLGAWSSYTESRGLLIVFLVVVILLTLAALVGGIMALAFRTTLIDTAKQAMKYSLKHNYGKKKLETESWDATQMKLRCCGVDNNGWSEYIGSFWDGATNADVRVKTMKLPVWSPYYKFVPQSCCHTLFDARTMWPSSEFRSLPQCQYWPYGPPNYNSGGFNDAVSYRGCFDAGAEFLSFHGRFLAGIGLFLFFIMVGAIICAFIVIINIDPEIREIRKKANMGYMMPGYGPGMTRAHFG